METAKDVQSIWWMQSAHSKEKEKVSKISCCGKSAFVSLICLAKMNEIGFVELFWKKDQFFKLWQDRVLAANFSIIVSLIFFLILFFVMFDLDIYLKTG